MNMSKSSQRGSALLTVFVLTSLMLVIALGLLTYSNNVRFRAIFSARSQNRQSCAEAGLLLARNYYAANWILLPTFLANPDIYDPFPATWMTASGKTPSTPTLSLSAPFVTAFHQAHPELFADLDGDTVPDVYFYIRDNQDEQPMRDYDQTVIVGALCISNTLVPKSKEGQPSQGTEYVEGLMQNNSVFLSNNSQYAGGNGNNNLNR